MNSERVVIFLCKIGIVLVVAAGVLLIMVALEQIAIGIYQAGCFRRYNQLVDTIVDIVFGIDPDDVPDILGTSLVVATFAVIVAAML